MVYLKSWWHPKTIPTILYPYFSHYTRLTSESNHCNCYCVSADGGRDDVRWRTEVYVSAVARRRKRKRRDVKEFQKLFPPEEETSAHARTLRERGRARVPAASSRRTLSYGVGYQRPRSRDTRSVQPEVRRANAHASGARRSNAAPIW